MAISGRGRSRARSSQVWESFDLLPSPVSARENKAKCKRCKKELSCGSSNGTSRLHRHLTSGSCMRMAAAELLHQLQQQEGFAPVAAELSPLQLAGYQVHHPGDAVNPRLLNNNVVVPPPPTLWPQLNAPGDFAAWWPALPDPDLDEPAAWGDDQLPNNNFVPQPQTPPYQLNDAPGPAGANCMDDYPWSEFHGIQRFYH